MCTLCTQQPTLFSVHCAALCTLCCIVHCADHPVTTLYTLCSMARLAPPRPTLGATNHRHRREHFLKSFLETELSQVGFKFSQLRKLNVNVKTSRRRQFGLCRHSNLSDIRDLELKSRLWTSSPISDGSICLLMAESLLDVLVGKVSRKTLPAPPDWIPQLKSKSLPISRSHSRRCFTTAAVSISLSELSPTVSRYLGCVSTCE